MHIKAYVVFCFQAVEMSVVDRAVLPIENSSDGSIHRNYDLLLSHRLHIIGEVQLAINHCLMALPGVKKEGIKRVLSHPNVVNPLYFLTSTIKLLNIRVFHRYLISCRHLLSVNLN